MISVYEVDACAMSSACIWTTVVDVTTKVLAICKHCRLKTTLAIARVTGDVINTRAVWTTRMTMAIVDVLTHLGY